MKCGKCTTDIPAQFEFAIKQNVCPKCGMKLMPDLAMKAFLDLKHRLREVELTMDPAANYERLALFLIYNYEITPVRPATPVAEDKSPANGFVSPEPSESTEVTEESEEDMRRQIAEEAERERLARDWGMNASGENSALDDATQKRVEKLRAMAQRTSKSGVSVRRSED